MSGTIELAKTLMKSSIPSLSSHMHKGQAGRVSVFVFSFFFFKCFFETEY